jgi:hypothetical protein
MKKTMPQKHQNRNPAIRMGRNQYGSYPLKEKTTMPTSTPSSRSSNSSVSSSSSSAASSRPLPDDMMSMPAGIIQSPSPSPSPSPSQSQSPSPSKPTGTSAKSAPATTAEKALARKEAADALKFGKLQADLQGNIGGIGVATMILGEVRHLEAIKADGAVIIQHAEPLALRLTDLARQYESIYKTLALLMEASAWTALATEIAAIGIAIAVNHGLALPDMSGIFGAPQPPPPQQGAGDAMSAPTTGAAVPLVA